jgi:ribosomal protein L11 methyltransferase
MKREVIWKTSVQTTAEAEEAVAELLASHVARQPSSYTDAETGVTTVSAYSTTPPKNLLVTKEALDRGLAEIRKCGLHIGSGKITIRKLPREDWAESWKRHFPPLEIGNALLVKPSWSKRRPRKGQQILVLDPGLSFGTGQHPTTEFCLRELVRWRDIARKQSLLDIGTGSGILAIAAAKLGYAPVHAFDFDPQAVSIARANARSNRVQRKIHIACSDLTKLPHRSSQRYDIVCANLLADLLIAERNRILARLRPGGSLVVAGILKREFEEVQKAYKSAGMTLIAGRAQNEWRSGTFVCRQTHNLLLKQVSAATDKKSKSARQSGPARYRKPN